jgi:transposase
LREVRQPLNALIHVKDVAFMDFLDIKIGQEIAFKAERQTGEISAQILKKVLDQYKHKKKILLFWDNAPWHKNKAVRECLAGYINVELKNFPPYAPEENPQEHVWKDGRAHVTHNKFIADINVAARELLGYLNNTIFQYKFFGFKAF